MRHTLVVLFITLFYAETHAQVPIPLTGMVEVSHAQGATRGRAYFFSVEGLKCRAGRDPKSLQAVSVKECAEAIELLHKATQAITSRPAAPIHQDTARKYLLKWKSQTKPSLQWEVYYGPIETCGVDPTVCKSAVPNNVHGFRARLLNLVIRESGRN